MLESTKMSISRYAHWTINQKGVIYRINESNTYSCDTTSYKSEKRQQSIHPWNGLTTFVCTELALASIVFEHLHCCLCVICVAHGWLACSVLIKIPSASQWTRLRRVRFSTMLKSTIKRNSKHTGMQQLKHCYARHAWFLNDCKQRHM